MNLNILGEHSDDKGKQLEQLTVKLLKSLGYKNISKNEIGTGGQEIDVRGEFSFPSPGTEIIRPFICECKAYKNPVPITDWLKFLGKVLIEESKGNVDACFIALSGVNGNVAGSCRDLKRKRSNISLITGDELENQLRTLFGMKSEDDITTNVKSQTVKRIKEISLVYYDSEIYFLIGFSDNVYSLMDSNRHVPKLKKSAKLRNLIPKSTNYETYIDLEEDAQRKLRSDTLKKFVVAHISVSTSCSLNKIFKALVKFNKDLPALSPEEVATATNELLAKGLLLKEKMSYKLQVMSPEASIGDVADFIRYLLVGVVPVFLLGHKNYDKLINSNLVEEICRIQGNLSLDKKYYEETIQLMQLSPSALYWSLNPDPMIVTHRQGGISIDERMTKADVSYFLQTLTDRFTLDFRGNRLNSYFLETRNIVEGASSNVSKIKTNAKLLLFLSHTERIRLGKTDKSLGNQVIQIRLIDDTEPEPWQ